MIYDSPFDSEHYELRVGRLAIDDPTELDHLMAHANDRFDVVFLRTRADSPVVDSLGARGTDPLEVLVTSTWREIEPVMASTAAIVEVFMMGRPLL